MIRSAFAAQYLCGVALLSLAAAGCSDRDGNVGSTTDAGAGAAGSADTGGAAGATPAGGASGNHPAAGAAGELESGGAAGEGEGGALGAAGSSDTALGPAPVLLATSGKYAILAESGISSVPASVVTGDIGLSPAAASYITGFSLIAAGTHWTSTQVTGSVFAADNDPPTSADLTTAVADMHTAYTDAAGRAKPDFLNLGTGSLGGLTLAPGLYRWTSSVTVPTDVTLEGDANDVWIFQVTGDLKVSAAKKMLLSGKARAKNVFWQVAGFVDLGATSHSEGIVLSKTAITLETGATINGRLLAQTAVDIASSSVTPPAP
ncbi:MAG: ice-binding family protein [Polyangiaceae bacterium]